MLVLRNPLGSSPASALSALAIVLSACTPSAPAKTGGDSKSLGGAGAVTLGAAPTIEKAPPAPPVRVNQLGYVSKLAKRAVVVSSSGTPLKWELIDSSNKVLASGSTTKQGPDVASGDDLHGIDFGTFEQTGDQLKLKVGSDVSPPFRVAPDTYRKLKYDALAYFYQTRSGIEIKMPYAGRENLARPAGHLSDKEVACAPDAGCSYSLDVTGGWYDAGDHGKYVVNGGISVWTLLNQWERAKYLAKGTLAEYADGKLQIPENANKIPDLLDEVRWEVEFLLKMQVPAAKDKANAGMVHHKIHDAIWTSLGTRPPTDTAQIKVKRFLRPISTAATLNLAAAAGQAARVYKEFDAPFAERCLAAAELAWKAALAHPAVMAKANTEDTTGGGPYDDKRLSDEFYWAATELYITTKKPEYQQYIAKSPFYLTVPEGSGEDGKGAISAFTWQSVAGAATISLAVVPSGLSKADVEKARSALITRADQYAKMVASEGYHLPFVPDNGGYPWGSNSFVLNNAMVLGLAHDFTHKAEYLNGVVSAMNYILGENPLGQSYVTGYGSRPLANPHHRFWAHQLNAEMFPVPPPGIVSGGPNSGLQDPVVNQAGLKGCKPQKCFIDDINAYSVNEITINWNGPLAWVAAFIDEKGEGPAAK